MAEASRKHNEVPSTRAKALRSVISDFMSPDVFDAKISLKRMSPNLELLDGTLYTACSRAGLVVVATGEHPAQVYHIVPISTISSFNIVTSPSSTTSSALALPQVASAPLLAKATLALARSKEAAAKMNKNVDKTTQDLFGAFDKQFSARWQGKDIVVMERVVVKAPGYRTEDCKVITKDGEGLLGRVRKVLENEKRRAAYRDGGRSLKPAIPNITPAVPVHQNLRKGG